MLIRIMTALALTTSIGLATVPAALACGEKQEAAAKPVPADASTVTVTISGMMCGGCAVAIRNALLKEDGIYDAIVSYDSGMAEIKLNRKVISDAKLDAIIAKAGFKAEHKKT